MLTVEEAFKRAEALLKRSGEVAKEMSETPLQKPEDDPADVDLTTVDPVSEEVQ